tara:strand:- start:676 stop:1410 length:735 start_codon:yes stop_codon:yes gene_type:complete
MGKAKVRLSAFNPTMSTDTKRTGIASKGSVGSRTWDQSNSNFQPQHKGLGNNAKLAGFATSLNFDGTNDHLDLSTVEAISNSDDWMFVIAFVDLDTSSDNTLLGFTGAGGLGSADGYLQIAAGGTGVTWNAATTKRSEVTTAINSTANSSTNYTFGSDVEVLILYQTGAQQFYYNIDGDLIGQTAVDGGFSNQCNLSEIGSHSGETEPLNAELLDVRIYTGSNVPPTTTASLQAIGNRYKQYKD